MDLAGAEDETPYYHIHPSRHYSQPSRSGNRRKQSFVLTLRRNRSQKALWKVVGVFFGLAHAPLMTFRVERQLRQRLPGGKWHSSGTLERSLLVSPLLSTRMCLPQMEKLYPLLLLKDKFGAVQDKQPFVMSQRNMIHLPGE